MSPEYEINLASLSGRGASVDTTPDYSVASTSTASSPEASNEYDEGSRAAGAAFSKPVGDAAKKGVAEKELSQLNTKIVSNNHSLINIILNSVAISENSHI